MLVMNKMKNSFIYTSLLFIGLAFSGHASSEQLIVRVATHYANVDTPAKGVDFEYTTTSENSESLFHECAECLTNEEGYFDILVDENTVSIIIHFDYKLTPIVSPGKNQKLQLGDLQIIEINGKNAYLLPCIVIAQPSSIDSDSNTAMWRVNSPWIGYSWEDIDCERASEKS